MPPTFDLTTKTDEELAQWFEDVQGRTGHELLVKIEFQKRLIKEQYKLNTQLVKKQITVLKWSIAVGFIGLILGAIVGAGMTVLGPTILSKVLSLSQTTSSGRSFQPTIDTVGRKSPMQEGQRPPVQSVTKEINESKAQESPPKEKDK